MLVTDWHLYFDILCDKYGNPYFTTAEKDLLFNRATLKFVDEAVKALEENDNVINKIQTLVVKTTALPMDGNGDLLYTAINTSISGTLYKIIGIFENGGGYVSEATHNAIGPIKTNTFKQDRRRCVKLATNLNFYPIDSSKAFYITVVKYPVEVAYAGPNSDLPDLSHNEILSIAVDLAGIASRNEALAQLNQLNK